MAGTRRRVDADLPLVAFHGVGRVSTARAKDLSPSFDPTAARGTSLLSSYRAGNVAGFCQAPGLQGFANSNADCRAIAFHAGCPASMPLSAMLQTVRLTRCCRDMVDDVGSNDLPPEQYREEPSSSGIPPRL